MSKELDTNLRNYQLDTEIPFSLEGLAEITELLEVVANNETTINKKIQYKWITKDGKGFNGQPKPEQIEKLGLRRVIDHTNMVQGQYDEVITPIGVNAKLALNGLYGFFEENIKKGTIKHKGESEKMSVVKE